MKCSKCGKDFGEGTHCQNCGIDRITGLANYSGYDSQVGNSISQYNGKDSSPNYMVCYACGEIIPADSKFCPKCNCKLYVTCPKCGRSYSSQYSTCQYCGTNKALYNKQLKAEKERARREERERQEREKEKEQQQQIKNRAAELKSSLSNDCRTVVNSKWFTIMGILIILSPAYITFILDEIPIYLTVPVAFIVAVLFIIYMCHLTGKHLKDVDNRIKTWKKEHPNDPRNKYL